MNAVLDRPPRRPLGARSRVCPPHRPLHSGQADRRAGARIRACRTRHRQAGLERESAGSERGGARGDRRRGRGAVPLSRRQRVRAESGAGRALRRGADRIVLGNGSNDVLELVTQAFLRPGDHAVYSCHAFAVYPLAVQARGATGIEVPARDYGHDLPAMRAAITPRRASCSSPIRTIRPARGSRRTRSRRSSRPCRTTC